MGRPGALPSPTSSNSSGTSATTWAPNCSSKPSSVRPINPSPHRCNTARVVAGPPRPVTTNPEASRPVAVSPTGKSPLLIATAVARLFFPQSASLGIDLGSISPTLLKKIVYAGSNGPSFRRASKDLRVLAEVTIDPKQVERLTEQIGQERLDERNADVAAWLARPLAERENPPPAVTPPQLAVVEMDGGRLQIRADADGPPDPSASADEPPDAPGETPKLGPPPAAKQPPGKVSLPGNDVAAATATEPDSPTERRAPSRHWREQKTGCLLQMSSTVSDTDPCPEIPAVFIDPLGALKLAQQIGHCVIPTGTPFQEVQPEDEEPAPDEENKTSGRAGRPEVETRRVLASRSDVHGFGPLLAATACVMGLFAASRRAFVADGLAENWSVYRRYFSRWTAVLDFVHAMTYVYAAAMAARPFAAGWPVYERWIGWVWAGQVSRVLEELTRRQQEVGVATKEDKDGSPRRVVQEALTYLSNHQDKMRYDAYRKQGLPLMSSHVESTVKQINYRVKGTEKFWSEAGAEAILQLRADYLSDDEPLEGFWQRRQEAATGQRRYRRRAG
jgi:hypothetical protein